MKIYLAGALFTLAERSFNIELATALTDVIEHAEVLLPQRDTQNLPPGPDFRERAFRYCLNGVDTCDVLVAMIEGADVDSGTCVEVGYAFAKRKRIIGVRTDFRESEDRGVNLM